MQPTQSYMQYQCFLRSGMTEQQYCQAYNITMEELQEMKRVHDKLEPFFNKKLQVQSVGF